MLLLRWRWHAHSMGLLRWRSHAHPVWLLRWGHSHLVLLLRWRHTHSVRRLLRRGHSHLVRLLRWRHAHSVRWWCHSSSSGRSHRSPGRTVGWWRRTPRAAGAGARVGLRVIDKLHKLCIIISTALKRRAIFNHKPKEARLHVCVAFSNDIEFRRDIKRVVVTFAQCLGNGTKTIGE